MQEIRIVRAKKRTTSQIDKLFREIINKNSLKQDQTSEFQIHSETFSKIVEQIAKGQTEKFREKLERLGKEFIEVSREYRREMQRVQTLSTNLGKDESGTIKMLRLLFVQDYDRAFQQIGRSQTINNTRFMQLIQKCHFADTVEKLLNEQDSDSISGISYLWFSQSKGMSLNKIKELLINTLEQSKYNSLVKALKNIEFEAKEEVFNTIPYSKLQNAYKKAYETLHSYKQESQKYKTCINKMMQRQQIKRQDIQIDGEQIQELNYLKQLQQSLGKQTYQKNSPSSLQNQIQELKMKNKSLETQIKQLRQKQKQFSDPSLEMNESIKQKYIQDMKQLQTNLRLQYNAKLKKQQQEAQKILTAAKEIMKMIKSE